MQTTSRAAIRVTRAAHAGLPCGVLPAAFADAGQAHATAEHDAFVDALDRIAARIGCGDPGAEPALRALLAQLAAHPDPRCVGLYVFGAALAARLAGQARAEANLYLQRFEVPQIELFNLLGRAVPFVSLATRICNDAIADAIAGRPCPTVIDVGIGTGRQMVALLEGLAATGRLPQALTVIGIEPSGWALAEAQCAVKRAAAGLGVRLAFHAFEGTAEALGADGFERIRQACTDRPVVNASFALHHIADGEGGVDQRGAVLRRLHALDPLLVVLAEPDSDHLEPRLHQRFRNCMAHFGAVFRTLDRLDLSQADRDALKVGFFGREIADILAAPEAQRSERHESATSWLQRLAAAGFQAQAVAARRALPASGHAAVTVARRGMHVALQAGDEPVVALIAAAPRRATPAASARFDADFIVI